VTEKWGETEDKPAVLTLAAYALVGLVAADGVLKAVDGRPSTCAHRGPDTTVHPPVNTHRPYA